MDAIFTVLRVLSTMLCVVAIYMLVLGARSDLDDVYRWTLYRHAKRHPDRTDLMAKTFGRCNCLGAPDPETWGALALLGCVIALLIIIIALLWMQF